MLNPTFGAQPIREAVGLRNAIKLKKGGNFREAARRDWNVGDLGEMSVQWCLLKEYTSKSGTCISVMLFIYIFVKQQFDSVNTPL